MGASAPLHFLGDWDSGHDRARLLLAFLRSVRCLKRRDRAARPLPGLVLGKECLKLMGAVDILGRLDQAHQAANRFQVSALKIGDMDNRAPMT